MFCPQNEAAYLKGLRVVPNEPKKSRFVTFWHAKKSCTIRDISVQCDRVYLGRPDLGTPIILVRGCGGVLAVMYEAHWVGLLNPSWEHERDLQLNRPHILRYWLGTPSQHRQTNRLYRQVRIGAAHRELSRSRGEIFLAPGYSLVPRTLWLHRFSSSPLPAGAHLWYKARDGLLLLGKVAPRASTDTSSADSYTVRFLDDPGPIKITLLRLFTPLHGAYPKDPDTGASSGRRTSTRCTA